MKGKIIIGLVLVGNAKVQAEVENLPANISSIDISGDKMIYMKKENLDWNIYLYNLELKNESQHPREYKDFQQ